MTVYIIQGTSADETIATGGTTSSVTSTGPTNNATDQKDDIRAGGGNDTVMAGDGDDLVKLGSGNDTFLWGEGPGRGSDTVDGGSGIDRAALKGFGGNASLTAKNGHVFFTVPGATVDFVNVERITIRGSDKGDPDTFTIGNLAGTHLKSLTIDLSSTSTSTVVDNQADSVSLAGTAGADRIDVTLASASTVRVAGLAVKASISYLDPLQDTLAVDGGRGNDIIDATKLPDTFRFINLVGGAGDDRLLGGAGSNSLEGGNGRDVLSGGGGNDKLFGDSFSAHSPDKSVDSLRGGGGADAFWTSLPTKSAFADRILDFKPGVDKIVLYFMTDLGATIDADEFVIGRKALDANDYLIYDDTTGNLFYDSNGSEAGGATRFAILGKGLALSASDFSFHL